MDEAIALPKLIASMHPLAVLRLQERLGTLEGAEPVIRNLALRVEAHDPYTAGHSQRIAKYATAIGRRLGLDLSDLSALETGGALHDVGKIGISDRILLKPGPLTTSEFEIIKQHTILGDQLCRSLPSLHAVRPIVRHHHERLDGSGYPDGLRGIDVPLLAQIISIVDVYDALITDRPYRRALAPDTAREILKGEAARGWRDATLVDVFLIILNESRRAA
jgi:putative two-component system response regulator